MSNTTDPPVTVSIATRPQTRRATHLPRFLRRPGGIFGAAWLGVLTILSLTAPLWQPYGPNVQNTALRLQGPTVAHWLGTDELGRDILTRIFTAAVPALLGAGLATAVSLAIAIPLVLFAAEREGAWEWTTSRGSEVVMALPGIVILLAVISALGGGDQTYAVMAILGVLGSAAVYRVLLNKAKALHQPLYIAAARVDGVRPVRIGARYVLPGLGNVIAVQASIGFAAAILVGAGLAFMGFGPPPPTASWGSMISSASQYIYQQPWLMVPTGVVLALTVIAANELALALAPGDLDARPLHGRRRRPTAAHRDRGAATSLAVAEPEPAPTAPLLEVSGLTLQLEGGPLLVTDVSLCVDAGRVLGLIGESGCGKTVTSLAVLQLLPPEVSVANGSIRLSGRELTGMNESQLRGLRGREIAMIPQDPMVALDPLFTIGSLMTEPLRRLHGVGRSEARRMAIDLLRQVEIHEPETVLRQRPYELSGGMAQRVMIAIALSGQPRLLIADEPTTALDVTVQMEILDLLHRLVQQTGVGLLIVSHDMGVIADICDDVAVMYAGQIVERGAVDDVLEHAQHPYTIALLAANPHVPAGTEVPARLAAIVGTVPRPGEWPTGCRFAARCAFATEKCRAPVALEPARADVLVRCVRVDQIARILQRDGVNH